MQNIRITINLILFLLLNTLFIFSFYSNINALTVSAVESKNISLSIKKNGTIDIPDTSKNDTKLKIFASFYPIYEFVKSIGKNLVDVSMIVPFGIEPHDFEPTAKQIINLQKSDLIFINGAGFESWLNKVNNLNIVDLSKNLTSELAIKKTSDPHFWLDPVLVKLQAKTIYQSLVKLDPTHIDEYKKNYQEFINDLNKLDSEIASNLTNCKLHDFIAFHDAFSYFSKRYGLNQHSIEGLSPELVIPPKKIADAIALSKQLDINVIFTEDKADPRLAESISNEIHGKVLVLSPIEIITLEEQKLNKDYFSKMLENMDNLKVALKCDG